jgi:hypothetical protein
LLTAR